MTWRRKKPERGGFTLLEIVVSLAIISITLTALLAAQNRALVMDAQARELTDAVTLAREEMERLHIETLPEPGVSGKRKRDDFPAFEWRTEIAETPFEGVWEARIKVFHVDDEKESDVFSMTAYVEGRGRT